MAKETVDVPRLIAEVVAEAKRAGLVRESLELHRATSPAFTTSSEYLGEAGLAIKQFLQSGEKIIPPLVRSKLEACLAEIRKVWPEI